MAGAARIAGPTITSNVSGHIVTGLEFQALTNATLTAFTFQNQRLADTIVLTDTTGNILQSISTPASTPSDAVSVNWSLTSGNSYWLLQTTTVSNNGRFAAFTGPLPSNTDIAIENEGTFANSIASAVVGGDAGPGFWADFNDITTSSSVGATPLPAALPLFATGIGGLGLLGWRRKRKAQAVA